MQCNRQLCVRGLRETLCARPRTIVPCHAHLSAVADSHRCLHVTRSQRQSNGFPTVTSSEARISEVPLKVTSASGSTPSPEDPEESGDRDPAVYSDTASRGPRPVIADSFGRGISRPRGRPRGSSSRMPLKSERARKLSIFKPEIPEWFISRNVTLADELDQVVLPPLTPVDPSKESSAEESSIEKRRNITLALPIRTELEAHLSAALVVRPGGSRDIIAARKAHLYLQCPRRGAIYFLDNIVEELAKELRADIVRLDGQDLDELLEDIIDPTAPDLGFSHPQIVFTNIVRDQSKDLEQKEELNSEENEEVEDDEEPVDETNAFRLSPDMPLRFFRLFSPRSLYSAMVNPNPTGSSSSSSSMSKEDTDSKVSAYLNHLLSTPANKRKRSMRKPTQQNEEGSKIGAALTRTARTIVYMRDFQSILDSSRGQIAHQTLLNIIQNRRRLGEQIVLVVSDDISGDNISPLTLSNQFYHILKIPPPKDELERSTIQADRKARIREINLRSLQSAIRQRSGGPSMVFDCPVGIHLDPTATSSIPELDTEIWEVSKIQRIASVVIGHHGRWIEQHNPPHSVPITLPNIAQAINDVLKADQERTERKQESNMAREAQELPKEMGNPKPETPVLAPLKTKDCNKHEQKLLGGVIDPEKIKVGFSDIRAPASTIETLKILVSLPLRRPDAFSYGVLSRNFINGVLLFGPPGTGKTMLAKAVAKESGARVLEIKGSEVYDMYVGEGEKNVKAIFSLARKLSPCVVFIDEVDTIFSSRNASERHVSHREIINQFMAEWDGINALNSGVLILGATNRPFDLDDAILRRMPRRILVDLPTEEDRLAILKLLLADEELDPTVDLSSLAKRTNLYSGSDLKNVCVSAAVTAVTEETASRDILEHAGSKSRPLNVDESGDVKVAERRILHPSHFEKALTEVTPSISESMETIELLRKFDKQYGNAKDKKKKLMGFGTDVPEAVANVRVVDP